MNLSILTDSQLLGEYAKNGSGPAFQELVRRHASMVHSVCRRASGRRRSDCEDMVQAVFVTLARKAGCLEGHVSLAGWLHRTAWYIARRVYRAMALRRDHERNAGAICAIVRQENIERERLREEIHRVLERLPDPYREPLILHHVAGWTIQECARLMDANPGTVASRLSRGRDMLREQLAGTGLVISAAIALMLVDSMPTPAVACPGARELLEENSAEASAGAMMGAAGVAKASIAVGLIRRIGLAAALLIGSSAGAIAAKTIYISSHGNAPAASAVAVESGGSASSQNASDNSAVVFSSATVVPEPTVFSLFAAGSALLLRRPGKRDR